MGFARAPPFGVMTRRLATAAASGERTPGTGSVEKWAFPDTAAAGEEEEGPLMLLYARRRGGRDDASTLDALAALLEPMRERSPLAAQGLTQVRALRAQCDRTGRLPEALQSRAGQLVGAIEQALA